MYVQLQTCNLHLPSCTVIVCPPHLCLQDEVVKLLEAACRAPAAAEQQRPLKAADVLHLAVNLQDPTPAAATLREVSQLRNQLCIQQLSELLQQQICGW
jgi:hypothetical protein